MEYIKIITNRKTRFLWILFSCFRAYFCQQYLERNFKNLQKKDFATFAKKLCLNLEHKEMNLLLDENIIPKLVFRYLKSICRLNAGM